MMPGDSFRSVPYAQVATGPGSSRFEAIGKDIYSKEFLSLLLDHASSKSVETLEKYIYAISLSTDSFGRPTKRRVKIIVELNADSRLQFDDGSEVAMANVPLQTLELVPEQRARDLTAAATTGTSKPKARKLMAVWDDPTGKRMQKAVKSLHKVTFEVTANLTREEEEAGDEF